MYCGSCMHDNAVAKSLRELEVDCVLQPIYTPIQTDTDSIAQPQVFFGGIHIYLLQQFPWLRFVPFPLRHLLDWPPLIRLATRRASSTDAAKLGQLAISMLKGTSGRQAEEVERFTQWLDETQHPEAVVFSNLLIGGSIPQIRRRLPNTQVIVLLQGDDIFLDHLPEAPREKVIQLCSNLVSHVDQFIVNSQFYAEKMSRLLSIPEQKLTVMPLSIDPTAFHLRDSSATDAKTLRIGYLARIAPEKGLHRLVDSFIDIAQQPGFQSVTLEIAGWLGEANQAYFDSIVKRIDAANLGKRFTYHGSVSLEEKSFFLQQIDLLCVPTEYEDPKGLFALEAMASGVPVVLPEHGAFPELIESTGGGILVPPNDSHALTTTMKSLLQNSDQRSQLGLAGYESVHAKHSIRATAEALYDLLKLSCSPISSK